MATHWDLLESAQTLVMGLPGMAGASSAIRSRPFCSTDHGDVLPFVCFSFERESIKRIDFRSQASIDYPVYVTIFREKGPALEDSTAIEWMLDRRAEVRSALWQPRALLDAQYDAHYEPQPVIDLGGLDQVFSVSVQRFVFTVNEDR